MAVVGQALGPLYGATSGELLDPGLVALGRKCERELTDSLHVFDRVQQQDGKGTHVRSKWVEDYKDSGGGRRIVRPRLVAMGIAWDARTDAFAGTPPLAVRLALVPAASLGADCCACLCEISAAFYHAMLDEATRAVPPRGE